MAEMTTPPVTTTTTTTMDLRLDDDSEPLLEQPRRLVNIGPHQNSSWAAYGGDFGKVVALLDGARTAKVVRHSDDAIRVIAANPSGTKVAVGTDSGDVLVYEYPPETVAAAPDNPQLHPFLALPESSSTGTAAVAPSQASQDDMLFLAPRKETCWLGPTDGNPIRDVVWASDTTLLVASESYWCSMNAHTSTSLATTRTVAPELEHAHNGGGIRSLTLNDDHSILLSLGMDGRACWWRPTPNNSSSDAEGDDNVLLDWTLLHRETTKCVSRNDVGEVHGASPGCRSSRGTFVFPHVAALPGEPFLQLRRIVGSTIEIHDQIDLDTNTDGGGDDGNVRGHVQPIVTMTSRDGYLVTSGRDGRVIVWDIVKDATNGTLRAVFVRQLGEYDSAPTDLVWTSDVHSTDEVLWIVTGQGQLITIHGRDNIAPIRRQKSTAATSSSSSSSRIRSTSGPSAPHKNASEEPAPLSDTAAAAKATTSPPHSTAVPNLDNDDDDDDDPFGRANTDSEPLPPSPKTNSFIDDQAAEDDDDDDDNLLPAPSGTRLAPEGGRRDVGDHSDNDDDDDDGMDDVHYPPVPQYSAVPHQQQLQLPEPQAPFAPSSTPLDLSRRFLCWNHVGSVTRLQGEPGVSRTSIDIDFTDSAFRRPISFTDNLGFVLGSLGEDGGIFCTDVADDESDAYLEGLNMSDATKEAVKKSQKSRMRDATGKKPTGSSIYFHRFESLGSLRDKDWHLTLPNDERALGCACGHGWAAVVTSRRFLRLYTSGGNQGRVLWLPGEPVTMVGRSRFLVVVFHRAAPMHDGTQQLGCMLLDAAAHQVLHQGPLSCVSKASSLTWIGFGHDHSALAMDSDGMLSMLVCSGAPTDETTGTHNPPSFWDWVPMLDTVGLRKSHDDHFWPITVYDGKLVCVPLKGGTKYPDAARKPVTTSLSFRLPLARGPMVPINALEELAVRADIALSQKKVIHDIEVAGAGDEAFDNEYYALSAQVDKVILKMFAGIVEAKKLDRALDLVDKLHLEKSYDLAMRIADHHHKLVDRIEDAKNLRFGAPPVEYGYDDPTTETATTAATRDLYEQKESSEVATATSSRITPDTSLGRKRALHEDEAPTASHVIRSRRG